IMPVSLDREALALTPDDIIHTNGWLRPRLWAGKAILPVNLNGDNTWVALGRKHRQGKMSASAGGSNASVNTALT
ncbi:MAG: hypothetical protein JW771_03725, partial [Candidatus Thermoplasmatota archaeon]|nr:hypothetical protein [Candidatus Thermoplasmatota archaeon]